MGSGEFHGLEGSSEAFQRQQQWREFRSGPVRLFALHLEYLGILENSKRNGPELLERATNESAGIGYSTAQYSINVAYWNREIVEIGCRHH